MCLLMGAEGGWVVVGVGFVPGDGLNSRVWLVGVFALCMPLLSEVVVFLVPWWVFVQSGQT